MKRVMSIGLAAATVVTLIASSAFAQRDAGAKARGEITGFWDSKPRQVVRCRTRNVVVRKVPEKEIPPTVAQDESQGESVRRFSYEPSADTPRSPAHKTQCRTVQRRSSVKRPTPPEVRLHPGIRRW